MKITYCVLALAGLVTASGAWAKDKEKSWTVEGSTLAISSPCAKVVTIEPSSTLVGKVEVNASAERQSEIDQLQVSGGPVASIEAKDRRCKSGWPHFTFGFFHFGLTTDSSLEVTVTVPAGMAIDIRENNNTDYAIGAVAGTLHLDLSGSGDVEADEAKDLVVHLSGSGSAQLDKVSGKLEGNLSGSGDLSIGRAEVSTADLSVSGSGDVSVDEGVFFTVTAHLSGSGSLSLGEGKVGALTVSSSGNSDVQVDATVTDADLSASGSGDISLREVTGQMKQSKHGSGSITIGK